MYLPQTKVERISMKIDEQKGCFTQRTTEKNRVGTDAGTLRCRLCGHEPFNTGPGYVSTNTLCEWDQEEHEKHPVSRILVNNDNPQSNNSSRASSRALYLVLNNTALIVLIQVVHGSVSIKTGVVCERQQTSK